MDDDLKRLLESMRLENGSAHEETRRHFDVVAERLDGKIDSVAELLIAVDGKVDRESTEVHEQMREGFSETQAMIRFSHAELDLRVRSLEDTQRKLESAVNELRERIERLETPAH